jgi:choline kinase
VSGTTAPHVGGDFEVQAAIAGSGSPMDSISPRHVPELTPLRAIVLAAGGGSRLGSLGSELPKCLLDVGGCTLIEQQINSLNRIGVRDILIVAGFEHQKIENAVRDQAEIIINRDWDSTNSLASFLLARDWVTSDVVVTNGDVLCHPDVFKRLATSDGSYVAYDSSSGLDDEHMKVAHDRGRLVAMTKEMPSALVCGENVGVLRLSRDVAEAAFDAGAHLLARGRRRAWLAEAITAIAPNYLIWCVDIADLPWTEIDFPNDLALARSLVWPSIRDSDVRETPAYAEARIPSRDADRTSGGDLPQLLSLSTPPARSSPT